MRKPVAVDPNQNVSPTKSLHYDGGGQVSGGSQSLEGGVPLRLSLAASLLGNLITLKSNLDLVPIAFDYADQLIARYNEDLTKGGGDAS